MTLDLDAYFARIGWNGPAPQPSAAALRSLNLAHVRGIPFENLDPVLGTVPSLALDDIQRKLVHGGRGGYCYEQNTLFAAVLEALGFGVTRLAARVRRGVQPGETRPRAHMLLLVDVHGLPGPYLADVGFGSDGGLLEAVPLVAGSEFGGERRHRLLRERGQGREPLEYWVLQSRQEDVWCDQYAFTLEPYETADYEMFNWHIATGPRSPFRKTLYVQRTLPGRHLFLTGRRFTDTRADGTVLQRDLADGEEVLRVLAEEFAITLPEGVVLPQ
ncbi:arylamine N-acetyltransferase [Kitasatospora sp. NBC_01250]|uniref:arylamine N-acetyltransferase family protein n=1 Tax=Kitasatospora sp. NBC_01250 TaxID=2903571 RepID=UPI002E3292B1|nr:arylamine N-acetyltransferase [Kitasatospora sp. NBC_01250]